MCDFVEIWDLRNKLILDGFYSKNDDEPVDGLELEKKITRLAREHYGWEEPKPKLNNELNNLLTDEIKKDLMKMDIYERIQDALNIMIDCDGYRGCRGLISLIDEVRARLGYKYWELK